MAECKIKRAAREKLYRARRRAAGKCHWCNRPAAPGKSLCERHLGVHTRHVQEAHTNRDSVNPAPIAGDAFMHDYYAACIFHGAWSVFEGGKVRRGYARPYVQI